MSRRKTIGLAAASAMLAGLGAFGATAAYAASSSPSPQPAPSGSPTATRTATSSTDAMIRHCTNQLPAGERANAREQMQKMMTTGDNTATNPMTNNSMMGGSPGSETSGMG